MTVEMLLKSLNVTDEERELHKALIEQCLRNERNIAECSASTKKNIEKISTVLEGIFNNMMVMEGALKDLARGAEEMSLRMLPTSEFFRE
ncbi:MAG TPA: hypothetical protein VHO84_02130 [Syntrophorhabdaceae bacterium]|nr:hypothetical protein [Syntrophorhabdaceae bacterium]